LLSENINIEGKLENCFDICYKHTHSCI